MVSAMPEGRRPAAARTRARTRPGPSSSRARRRALQHHGSSLSAGSHSPHRGHLRDTTVDLEAPPPASRHGRGGGVGRPLGTWGSASRTRAAACAWSTCHIRQLGPVRLRGLEPEALPGLLPEAAYQVETRELAAAEEIDVRVEMRRGEGIGLEARDGIFATPSGASSCAPRRGGQAAFAGSVSLDSEGRGEVPLPEAGRLRAAGRVLRLRAGEARRRHGAVVGDHPRADTRRISRDPGGAADARAAGRERAARRGGRPRLHVERLHDGREDPPDSPVRRIENVVPSATPLEVEGASAARWRSVRNARSLPALSLRQVEADEASNGGARRQDGDGPAATGREVPQIPVTTVRSLV